MILRRLSQSLRQQNWTAICIEFVLLVAGVFLGIQVANWNEERQLNEHRRAALERMQAESEADISYLHNRLNTIKKEAELRTEVLQRLSANDWLGADLSKMTDALDSMQYLPAFFPPQSVYNELISTGLFSELGDAQLRDAVSTYIASTVFVQGQIDYLRSRFVSRNEGRVFAGAQATFDPKALRQLRMVYDFPLLSKDNAFVSNAILNNVATIAQVQWTEDVLSKAKTMCNELARFNGRLCKDTEQPSS